MANKHRENRFRTFLKSMFEKRLFVSKISNLFLRNKSIGYPHPFVNKLLINCVHLNFAQMIWKDVDNQKSFPLSYKQAFY